MAASTRVCSATSAARTSTPTWAAAGTVLCVVPPDSAVGVTVVAPAPMAAMARIWWASSIPAFAPFSGSRPECAALPCTLTW